VSKVVFRDLTKLYDKGVVAVDHVSFEVADKEFFVLVGPSGCGKSTTLRLVAGLEEPTSGEIHIGDKFVNNVEPRDRDIAMVFQNYALYPHMTVQENMAFALKLRKVPRDEVRRRVDEAARILDIADLLKRRPAQLSGGQRQRVAVGRAIVRHPKVFLFDEPLSNLDAKLRVGMRAELARIHRRLETTVFYVTHDQVEAMTLGQRIGVMKDGRLLQVADSMTLYNQPVNKFVAGFIGSPPMNFLKGAVESAGSGLCFRHTALSVALPAAAKLVHQHRRPVELGVRPEDISLTGDQGCPAGVEVVELMGSEAVAYLRVGDDPLVARLPPRGAPRPGDSVRIALNADRVHLFDQATGQTLV
jgi:multiple sugar transport system ATP-binding protein